MKRLLGRADVFDTLTSLLDGGHTVLVYGPVGIGKSSLIRALQQDAESRGIPCGVSPKTEALSDLTMALARAYPRVDATSGPMRHIRARLRNAVEQEPCRLFLDDVRETGTAFKGALKSLRGTGAGVLLAADVEKARDHASVRGLHLAYREMELAPLHGTTMRTLLKSACAAADLPFPLLDGDLRSLVVASDGLPGRAIWFVEALKNSAAWRSRRPRCGWLRTGAIIAAAEKYQRQISSVTR